MKMVFENEAALVRAFIKGIEAGRRYDNSAWQIYAETAGWDLLLVHKDHGTQVGVEAKMALNTKVLLQALEGTARWAKHGPDYRAVLVPGDKIQGGLAPIARRLGLTVMHVSDMGWTGHPLLNIHPQLPQETANGYDDDWAWFPWCPDERHPLPEYVPDVEGGHCSPLSLTKWKIAAIKVVICLERQGHITRKDIKALGIDPGRWCNTASWLIPTKREGREMRYERGPNMPDFRAQHPRNFEEILADWPIWSVDYEKKRAK